MQKQERVRVWDRFVRAFHWALVASFAIAYFSTVGVAQEVHDWSGYTAIALVIARCVWGFVGSKHARFADFVPTVRGLWKYVGALIRGHEPRYIGHNPAGAVMILFLLAMVTAIGMTGWMLTLDAFWGSETVEDVHAALVNITLIAVAVHVCAAIYESWKHRENLVWSMVVGTKRTNDADPAAPVAHWPAAAPTRPTGARSPSKVDVRRAEL